MIEMDSERKKKYQIKKKKKIVDRARFSYVWKSLEGSVLRINKDYFMKFFFKPSVEFG